MEIIKSVYVFTAIKYYCCFVFFPEGTLWQAASKLNSLLTSENERLKQLTDDLKQKHSHMTSEVQIILPYSLHVSLQVEPSLTVTKMRVKV